LNSKNDKQLSTKSAQIHNNLKYPVCHAAKLNKGTPDSNANEPIIKKADSLLLASCANLTANLRAASSK